MKRAVIEVTFDRLLAERAGIGGPDLEELRGVHARAGKFLRSIKAKMSHAARQGVEHEETGIVEAISAETAAPAAEPALEEHAPPRPAEPDASGPGQNTPPDWRVLYKDLQRDWNALVARAKEPDSPLSLMNGYDALIPRVYALAAHPDLTQRARDVLEGLLEYHDNETVARQTAENYLTSAERHVEIYKALERQASDRGVPVTQAADWLKWREAAEMLASAGEAILSNEERYGAYLDAMTIGKARARLTVEQLRNRLHQSRVEIPEAEGPTRQPQPAKDHERGFAHLLDDPERLRELREKAEERGHKLDRHQRRSRGLSM